MAPISLSKASTDGLAGDDAPQSNACGLPTARLSAGVPHLLANPSESGQFSLSNNPGKLRKGSERVVRGKKIIWVLPTLTVKPHGTQARPLGPVNIPRVHGD